MKTDTKFSLNENETIFACGGQSTGARRASKIYAITSAIIFVLGILIFLIVLNDSKTTFGSFFSVFAENPIMIAAFALIALIVIILVVLSIVYAAAAKSRDKTTLALTHDQLIFAYKKQYITLDYDEVSEIKCAKFELLKNVVPTIKPLRIFNSGRVKILTKTKAYSVYCGDLQTAMGYFKERFTVNNHFHGNVF